MTMTMGMIDCKTEDFDEVSTIFNKWYEEYKGLSNRINPWTAKIVPVTNDNFYGGVKVGVFVDIKHDYYNLVFDSLIKGFENLMNALSASSAILYHDGSGNLIEWFENTPKSIQWYQERNDVIENTDFPNICRVTRGDCRDLPSFKLDTLDR